MEMDLVDEFENYLGDASAAILVRRAAALALGTLGEPGTSIPVLLEAAKKDGDTSVAGFALVSAALLAARAGEGAEILPALRNILEHDRDARIRGFAALAVGLTDAPGAGEALFGAFRDNHQPPDSADPAALALGWVRHGPALRKLADEVQKPRTGGDARGMAMLSMGRIGGTQTAEYLRSCVSEVSLPYIMWFAAQGLAEMGDRKGFEVIASLTRHRWFLARDGSYRALAVWGKRPALEVLIQSLGTEEREDLRSLIVHLLAELASAPESDRMAALAPLVPPTLADKLPDLRKLLSRRR